MAGIDIQLSQLPTLTDLVSTDIIHVKRGIIDYKVTFSEFLRQHTANTNNPHSVTKTQVGLGSVIDSLQLTASNNLNDLGNKAIGRDNLDVYSRSQVASLIQTSHGDLTNNPHSVTKSQVGLSLVVNAAQTNEYRGKSTTLYATQACANSAYDAALYYSDEQLNLHKASVNNPHSVTKSQVGLGNVSNFTVSTNYLENNDSKFATIGAVYDSYQNAVSQGREFLTQHVDNNSNPHSVTKAQVGLGSVNNASWSNSFTSNNGSVYATSKSVFDGVNSAKSVASTALNAHTSDNSNPHSVTKAQVGLGSVNNASWSDSYTNSTRMYATTLSVRDGVNNAKSVASSALSSHTSATNNPHAVTKSQVGLGSVNNAAWSDSYTTSTRLYATTLGLKNGLANAISQAVSQSKDYSDGKDPADWVRVLNVSGVDKTHYISPSNMVTKEIYIVCSDTGGTDEVSTAFALCPSESGFSSDANFYISVGSNCYFKWNYTTGTCFVEGELELRQVWVRDRSFFPDCGTVSA